MCHIVTQRRKPVVCLTLGTFWTINTQVLLVQNFQWSGVRLRCLITVALVANPMSGHLVRTWSVSPQLYSEEEVDAFSGNPLSFSRCFNVGNIHWRQNAFWEKHQLWSGNHGYPGPPTLQAEVGVQICIRGDAEMLAGGKKKIFFLYSLSESLKHLGIWAW